MTLSKRIISALLLSLLPSAMAFANCANLESALSGLGDSEFLNPGATHEAGILSGEMPSELNAARRDRAKQLKEKPEIATALVHTLGTPDTPAVRSPGEILFGLDLLTRTNPKLFVDAVDGMVNSANKAAAPMKSELRNQLTSRMISHLNITKPEDSIRLFEAMSKNPWARQYLSTDNNAARAMLTAMKQIKDAAKTDPAIASKLPSVRAMADEWIEPRRKQAHHPELNAQRKSADEDMDWAFSRTLASEMSQVLKSTDPAGAQHYRSVERELGSSKHAGEHLKNERVKGLFAEFGIGN